MDSQVIVAADCRRERWRNGLGWTREIFQSRSEHGWDWRLSLAEIDGDAAFSLFPGIDRELVLLSGNGLRLRFDDGGVASLLPPHAAHRFAGERAVRSELTRGAVQVFNLMWRRDRVRADLWRRPLVGPMVILAEPYTSWAVYVLVGHARFADESGLPPLQSGDTALLQDGSARSRHLIDGSGEVLVIRTRLALDAGRASGLPSAS